MSQKSFSKTQRPKFNPPPLMIHPIKSNPKNFVKNSGKNQLYINAIASLTLQYKFYYLFHAVRFKVFKFRLRNNHFSKSLFFGIINCNAVQVDTTEQILFQLQCNFLCPRNTLDANIFLLNSLFNFLLILFLANLTLTTFQSFIESKIGFPTQTWILLARNCEPCKLLKIARNCT